MPKPRKRYGGLIAEGRTGMGGPRVAILMPQTYMNDSGKAAGPARGELGVPIDRVIAVHDEIDLPFGEVRSKLGGGVAGHNGLKSLAQGLGDRDFWRVRGGVGRPDSTDPEIVSSYVLSRFREPREDARAAGSPRRRRNRSAGGADRRTRRRTQGGPGLMPLTSYAVDEKQVALIRLEREKARNAINTAMLEELLVHLTRAKEDKEARVLVISSNDHLGLSAGADVKEELDEQGRVRRMELFAELYDELTSFPKPTVAACHGSVVGGGAEIAVACDLRVGGSNLRCASRAPSSECRSARPGWSRSAASPPPSTCCSPLAASARTRRFAWGSSIGSRRLPAPRTRPSTSPRRWRPIHPRRSPASRRCCIAGTEWSSAPPTRAGARWSGSAGPGLPYRDRS